MENKISDINDLVLSLGATAVNPVLIDDVWRCYGYKKRPRIGNIWYKTFPKKFELESFIEKELLTMGFIDVLNGIKKSKETTDDKLLISIGVTDQILSVTGHMFSPDLFMENVLSTYDSYSKSKKTELHVPIVLKAKNVLNKKDFAKFMVGTIKLLAIEHADDFLIKSNYVKEIVEKSPKEGILKISISNEMYKKYRQLLSDRILKI